MKTRLGTLIAAATIALVGLALPAHAQTPASTTADGPVTAKQCTDGGGQVKSQAHGGPGLPDNEFYCSGGKYTGQDVRG